MSYEAWKLAHVALAILAGGSSAGMGILLERVSGKLEERTVLRHVGWIEERVVLPLLLALGAAGLGAMLAGAWPLSQRWLWLSFPLSAAMLAAYGGHALLLRRQLRALDEHGAASPRYKRLSLAGRALGAGAGLLFMGAVYLMVVKP
jgi:Predicted integral membrane protein (DUF2269)